MNRLFHGVVTHPVAVTMVFLAALVFGFVSYARLAVELMPDIAYPTITVRTAYEGAAPQEVESQVSRPVEEQLATLDGLVEIESRSRAGSSDVVLGFDWGTPMPAATQAIREKLQLLFLPQEAERPLILRYDPSLDPFLRVALSHAAPPEDPELALLALRDIADKELKRELEAMKGVAAVKVVGGLEREIRVEVREDWLTARKLRIDQVRTSLASENINLAGGSILEGDVEYLVRTLNQFRTAEELAALRIRRTDGVSVPLSDVALVHEVPRERQVISRLDRAEAVELEVYKEADANVVDVARRVKARLLGERPELPPEVREQLGLTGLAADLPEGMVLRVLDDQAEFIESSVSNLIQTAILGGLLAIVVLFLFLRDFRATAIIGAAIPVSVIMGFGPLYLAGVSLNLMSLGGLALGVGMLVDNAVVVLESIHRQREDGHERKEAAVRGVGDVAAAVTASTLTTVAVFFPIAFVEGVAGELFGDLAIAVIASLVASLLVALFLVPTLAAMELGTAEETELTGVYAALSRAWPHRVREIFERRRWTGLAADLLVLVLAWPVEGLSRWMDSLGERRVRLLKVPWVLLRAALQVWWQCLAVLVLVLVAVAARTVRWVARPVIRVGARLAMRAADGFQWFYGRVDRSYAARLPGVLKRPGLVLGSAVLLFVLALVGADRLGSELIPEVHQGRFTVEAALAVGTPLERTAAVVGHAERIIGAHPQVEAVYSTIGSDGGADARADEGEHTARIRVELTPGGDLEARENQVMEALRRSLATELASLDVKMTRPSLFTVQTPVEVVVHGYDLDELRGAGAKVAAALAQVPGLRDVRSSLVSGQPEVRIKYDRERLHRFGLDPATAASRVRDKVQGTVATEIHRAEERIDLRVQLVEADRATLAELGRINVNPNLVPPVPLLAVADLEEGIGPSEIRRVDQQRAVVVSANLEGFDLGGASGAIEAIMADLELPPEATWLVAGQSREMEQSLGSLQFALLLAIFLVYVIMASTFESITHPFVILLSVPLALVGVVVGLTLVSTPLSVVVFIGMIVLAGVVVNNAIVLVDKVNRLRAEGMARLDAIHRAGALRLRPILITTATTVLGLLPLSLGLGAGAEIQQPLAMTVIWGLLSSTALTLGVVPVMYRVVTSRERT